jgi:hypothetical protein
VAGHDHPTPEHIGAVIEVRYFHAFPNVEKPRKHGPTSLIERARRGVPIDTSQSFRDSPVLECALLGLI